MRSSAICVAAVWLTALAAPAGAQIVDVQSRLAHAPEAGLRGAAGLSGEWRGGNSESLSLSAEGWLELGRGAHQGFLTGAAELGRSGGERYLNRRFAHLRHRWHWSSRWALESFVQGELDEFRRLELRALAGAGVRLRVAGDAERVGLALGAAGMLELERIARDAAAPDEELRRATPRLSCYAAGSIAPAPGWELATTTYLQPALDDARDLRLSSTTALSVRPGERVALELSLALDRDARPPPGVDAVDARRRQGVTGSF